MKNSLGLLLIILAPMLGYAQPKSVPETCIAYAQENTLPDVQLGDSSPLFVKCANENAEPQRGALRPTYSRAEVQFIQKAFNNIEDCLDIPVTETFPRLMLESGFHPSIQSENGDTGIGQLTAPAIQDVDRALPEYKDKIFQSHKSSCHWLKSFSQSKPDFWKPVGNGSRCQLMAKNYGIIKNLLYSSILHKLNKEYVTKEYEKRHIRTLLLQAGVSDKYGPYIKELLVDLGYNTGGATAVKNLQDFLLSRIDYIQRKFRELLNPVFFHANKYRLGEFLNQVKAEDFNFVIGTARLNERREQFRKKFSDLNPNISESELNRLVDVATRNLSASELSFPEWLQIWQSHGGPGYVTSLAANHRRLDKEFGPGVCANSKSFRPY